MPIKTLYQRLGLMPYDRPAEYVDSQLKPRSVTIPLDSHIGRPATPTVSVGSAVKRGQLIADVPASDLGCPVHASINGRVTAVTDRAIQIEA